MESMCANRVQTIEQNTRDEKKRGHCKKNHELTQGNHDFQTANHTHG